MLLVKVRAKVRQKPAGMLFGSNKNSALDRQFSVFVFLAVCFKQLPGLFALLNPVNEQKQQFGNFLLPEP
jgi:hypothetical protein